MLFIKIILISLFAYSDNSPAIINSSSMKHVSFGSKIEKALAASKYKNFKPLDNSVFSRDVQKLFKGAKNNLPMATLSDLNGDKTDDLVTIGKVGKSIKILIFLSKGKTFKIQVFPYEQIAPFNTAFTSKSNLKSYLSDLPKESIINFSKDAFQLETYLGTTRMFYLSKGKFIENKGALKIKF